MPIVSTNDLKNGMTLELDGHLWNVVDFQHVKPGKGHAFVRSTLKKLGSGAVVERTFRAGQKVERAIIDKREMQYLYRDADGFVLMDTETYDQLTVAVDAMAGAADYLIEANNVVLMMFGDEVVGCDLPASVEIEISETEPGVQGDRVSGARKPATLSTGLIVQVPLFLNPGDTIKVDTRSGEYLSRG